MVVTYLSVHPAYLLVIRRLALLENLFERRFEYFELEEERLQFVDVLFYHFLGKLGIADSLQSGDEHCEVPRQLDGLIGSIIFRVLCVLAVVLKVER